MEAAILVCTFRHVDRTYLVEFLERNGRFRASLAPRCFAFEGHICSSPPGVDLVLQAAVREFVRVVVYGLRPFAQQVAWAHGAWRPACSCFIAQQQS